MKLEEAIDLGLMKTQMKKKIPVITPLIAFVFLCIIIPIHYYPSSSSTFSLNKITFLPNASSSSSSPFQSLDFNDSTISSPPPPADPSLTAGPINGESPLAIVKVAGKNDSEKSSNDWRRRVPIGQEELCDIFTGEWIPNPEAPYYTNMTCYGIQEHQNCMKYGRPDTDYLKWRWKPDGCDLALFDPKEFLKIMRGKSIAFVGDSVARNHMQSLMCLLSRVMYPVDVSNTSDENYKRWEYREYSYSMQMFWAPYLIRTQWNEQNDLSRPFTLYLDEFDDSWTNKIEAFDYVIISAGQWFFRPTMFYLNRRLVGCLNCPQGDVPRLPANFSYRQAFRTALRGINSLTNYKGVTFLRTFVPSHFEGGSWDNGGNCVRKKPFKRNETALEDHFLEVYKIQLEEFENARREGEKTGGEGKFRVLDMTGVMQLRPDGHPSMYGHWPNQKVVLYNDCVHWCLPGPIDTWNDFLLEMLRKVVIR